MADGNPPPRSHRATADSAQEPLPEDGHAAGASTRVRRGSKYDYGAAAAAEILNLHFDPSQPKAVLFGRILRAMDAAEAERTQGLREPSEN
jgi:hypothetical protein